MALAPVRRVFAGVLVGVSVVEGLAERARMGVHERARSRQIRETD